MQEKTLFLEDKHVRVTHSTWQKLRLEAARSEKTIKDVFEDIMTGITDPTKLREA